MHPVSGSSTVGGSGNGTVDGAVEVSVDGLANDGSVNDGSVNDGTLEGSVFVLVYMVVVVLPVSELNTISNSSFRT